MKKQQQMLRLIAIILVVLLVGSTVLSVVVSAFAEAPARNQYELSMEYLEEEQALHITQRLLYHNRTGTALDRVVFYATANMFRRESALMYEGNVIERVFPDGFAPAGIDLTSVSVNGEPADWGVQGTDETYLRVSCALAPGESCEFEFDYYLLLGRNRAFTGAYDTDVRLSAFYFIPGIFNPNDSEFVFNKPLQFTRWLYCDAADYSAQITLPDTYLPAATGTEALLSRDEAAHTATWGFESANRREFALSFGKRYREQAKQTDSGVTVRVLTNHRNGADRALQAATDAIRLYETWFGRFPVDQIDLVQSDYPLGALNFPGAIWLPEELFENESALRETLYFCLAQQYFGYAAYTQPSADAWLSDAVCRYIQYLTIEELNGNRAFLEAMNRDVLESLNMTMPGALQVTSDATLFGAYDYGIVVLDRGAVVLHETRIAMGREELIAGLRKFYEMGLQTDLLTEMNFVEALDAATGGNWEAFLTDWLFNVGDYVEQQMDWYE